MQSNVLTKNVIVRVTASNAAEYYTIAAAAAAAMHMPQHVQPSRTY